MATNTRVADEHVFAGTSVKFGTFTAPTDASPPSVTDQVVITSAGVAIGQTSERAAIKNQVLSAVIAVAVPTIVNDVPENADSVAVNVAAAFTMQPAVGDAVVAIPLAALPTDCLLCGCYVTGTDEITLTFASKEGGGGVTGANVNFQFLLWDLT